MKHFLNLWDIMTLYKNTGFMGQLGGLVISKTFFPANLSVKY